MGSLRGQPRSVRGQTNGLTLLEVLLGALTLAIVVAAILGAYMGQLTLNEHARNLSLAINDASRVIEQIRRENTGCTGPPADPPEAVPGLGGPSWDSWMNGQEANGVPRKTVVLNPQTGTADNAQELIVVTCLQNGTMTYCGGNQIGTGEWARQAVPTGFDVIQLTVAVCWRHRTRVIGECRWTGAALQTEDRNGDGLISSPAMLTTVVTCNGA